MHVALGLGVMALGCLLAALVAGYLVFRRTGTSTTVRGDEAVERVFGELANDQTDGIRVYERSAYRGEGIHAHAEFELTVGEVRRAFRERNYDFAVPAALFLASVSGFVLFAVTAGCWLIPERPVGVAVGVLFVGCLAFMARSSSRSARGS